ncbi:Kiwa anti-phage protein KwaB-like domain-containing protein [Paenibacillus sp. sgz5001063]|uniref:Kiwa anti-phage protein KwaB-like domain-containing protein n=1 Tax=Paenibacillus sp. sgz5001063 TaxID=3242474 RepID=UPI0036D38C4E
MTTLGELEQLKRRLEQANNKRAHLYFILKERRNAPIPFSVYKTVHTPTLSTAFFDMFKLTLDELLVHQVNIVPYDINMDTTESFQCIPVENVTHAPQINQPILNDETTEIFENVDETTLKKMWAYAVKVSFDNEHIIYYRKYSPGKILRPGVFNAIAYNGGRFSRVEENIFQIPNDVDAFCFNNDIVIMQPMNFERIFGYEELYEAASQNALQQIAATHNYVNMTDLNTFVGTDGRKKRKLAAILNNGLIPQMGFNQICTTIQHYNLDIQIDQANQEFTITSKNAFLFLKALNDDYLRSEITTNRYEISSKRRT